MGSVLSLERRQSLLTWAQRVGAYIIEDDYDAVFTYGDNPLPALKAMDYHNRVIYMGTFSKTLGPGARLGYLICPDELLPAVQNMKALNNNGSQWLLQQFLAELMQNQVFIRISASWPAAMRRASLCYAMACPLCFPKGKSLAQRQVCTSRYALPDIPNSSPGCNKAACWLGSVSTLCRI
jgi:GntR family transcriptional regulator/MocR family aminotransferase